MKRKGNQSITGSGYSKECHTYKDGAWELLATLSTQRQFSNGVVIRGSNGTSDKLMITGGYPSLKDVEFVYANGTVETGPNLPEANRNECGVQVETGDVYLLGGRYGYGSKGVVRFDVKTNTYTRLGNMNKNRDVSACTVFKSEKHEGREVIYVGGGADANKASILDYTQTEAWEEVDDIPASTNGGPRAVPSPDGKGVLHIYDSKVYELRCDSSSCTWESWPQRFTTDFNRKEWFQAMYIPAELVSCS